MRIGTDRILNRGSDGPGEGGLTRRRDLAILAALLLLAPGSALATDKPVTPLVTAPVHPKPPVPAHIEPPGPKPLAFGHPVKLDWQWVQGAVFVPTNCVNEAQQWDQYDPVINDRELHYAAFYGINCVRVYLHYDIYLKKKAALLADIEDFLTRAAKYGIQTEFVFFDDCWNEPDPAILLPDYQYPAPIYGVHNSRWLVSPGNDIKKNFTKNEAELKAYVQDIVKAHKADSRIAFWETYNEPGHSPDTVRLLKAAIGWIHETGTTIPATATGHGFAGDPYSDFLSWHEYGNYGLPGDKYALCTECMNRAGQTVPGIVQNFKGKTGFIVWELGIGRDNCRFTWSENRNKPRKDEPKTPFHGVIYPDGHPWSIDDAKALMGAEAFAHAPFFKVRYFLDEKFAHLAKESVTPMIDFDLTDEKGTGSLDGSAGMPTDHFSATWTGTLLPPATGDYTFYIDCDDRAKVYLDSRVLLEKSTPGRAEISQVIPLVAQTQVPIRIEYIHGTGNPSLHLSWSGPDLPKGIVLPAASH